MNEEICSKIQIIHILKRCWWICLKSSKTTWPKRTRKKNMPTFYKIFTFMGEIYVNSWARGTYWEKTWTFRGLPKDSNYYLTSAESTSSVVPAREVMTPARKQIFLIWFFFTQRRTITMFYHQPARKKMVVKIVTLLVKLI